MSDAVIPEDVKQFLLKHIDSIAQWEGLLSLRADPLKGWSKEELARILYVNDNESAHLLQQLTSKEFLIVEENAPDKMYRYAPKKAEADALIGRAAELYKKYLIPVTNLIHSKPKSRVQEFADAFKIRKD
jgi:hypothetical protein